MKETNVVADAMNAPDRGVEHASCGICGSSNYTVVEKLVRDMEYDAPGNFKWLQCVNCRAIRLDPIPDDALLQKAYPPQYHAFQPPGSIITRTLTEWSRKATAKSYARKLGGSGNVLDIGCSSGELLEEIGSHGKMGLFGIEYDEGVAKLAEEKGAKVWVGSIESLDLPKQYFDLITMQHVIEHVINPRTTLEKALVSLRQGGKIVGELPNFDSWDEALFRQYWGGGHAPRHIWHFTPRTLTNLLHTCGYRKIKISPVLHTGHWALSIQNWLRRKKGDCSDLSSGRTWYYPWLLLLLIPVNILQVPIMKTGVMKFEAEK